MLRPDVLQKDYHNNHLFLMFRVWETPATPSHLIQGVLQLRRGVLLLFLVITPRAPLVLLGDLSRELKDPYERPHVGAPDPEGLAEGGQEQHQGQHDQERRQQQLHGQRGRHAQQGHGERKGLERKDVFLMWHGNSKGWR